MDVDNGDGVFRGDRRWPPGFLASFGDLMLLMIDRDDSARLVGLRDILNADRYSRDALFDRVVVDDLGS